MKNIFTLFICSLLFSNLSAQTPKFKSLYTEKERNQLISNMIFSLGYSSEISLSYSTTELFNSKVIVEKPASLPEIEKQKKKLKGNDDDASIYLDISGLYSRLNQNKEAIDYRNKAIEIAEKRIEQTPDSIEPYLFLASVYVGALQPEKTIYYNRKASSMKSDCLGPMISNAFLFLAYGQVDSARIIINDILKKHPKNHRIYSVIPMLYVTNLFKKFNDSANENYFNNTPLDTILFTPLLDEIYFNNKSDFDIEFLYRVSRQILISTVVGIICTSDTAFDSDNVKFKIPAELKSEFESNTTFFKNCLNSKGTSYHFYANKLLGSIYLLNNDTKNAISYLRKTINLKPVTNCSITSNTNEDYYNLLGAYLILKDTVSYEKTLLEKIKIQPTIDPFSEDYTNLAMVYIYKNKMDLARQNFQKAKDIDDKNLSISKAGVKSNAIVGLGICDFIANDFEGAMKCVNDAYKQDSKQWEIYVLYASILIQQRDAINAHETIKVLMNIHNRKWIQKDFIDYFFESNLK